MIGNQASPGTLDSAFPLGGEISGDVLVSDTELSFWGGVDPQTGRILDRHHDLSDELMKDKILALPAGRGSCASSGVVMELLANGMGPKAILLKRPDDIIAFGVIVAEEVFGCSIPVIVLGEQHYERLRTSRSVIIRHGNLWLDGALVEVENGEFLDRKAAAFQIDAADQDILNGDSGEAARVAMNIIIRMAKLQGATRLHSVSQVHIDGCVYNGPASLNFAQKFRDWGGRVAVPTTLNSISVDSRRWRSQGVDPDFGEPAARLGEAYVAMGARATFTCAPYLLDQAPLRGEQIAWAESNAVVFANSVLAARTMKYPDYLDACIALTGRAPFAGCHLDEGRMAEIAVEVDLPTSFDDSLYPLLGYCIGQLAANRVPVICGLEAIPPSLDDLKAFSAAFATTSSAPMFHMVGVTPEAPNMAAAIGSRGQLAKYRIDGTRLAATWNELNNLDKAGVGLVSLGNPHFSLTEFQSLVALCRGRIKHPDVSLVITSGRSVYERAVADGAIAELELFGARFITDTCWCLIGEPIIPTHVVNIMTNSAKYAHYGPGLTGRRFGFGGLAACVEAACTAVTGRSPPEWLK